MSAVLTIIKRHPLFAYFTLVFAISWGAILIAVGPRGLFHSEANPAVLTKFIYLAALAGPSIAGILITGLIHGRASLRNLRSSKLLLLRSSWAVEAASVASLSQRSNRQGHAQDG